MKYIILPITSSPILFFGMTNNAFAAGLELPPIVKLGFAIFMLIALIFAIYFRIKNPELIRQIEQSEAHQEIQLQFKKRFKFIVQIMFVSIITVIGMALLKANGFI